MATAEIRITLKPTLLDAQGATVSKALRQLGHAHVQNVRIGKYITVDVADDLIGPALQSQLEMMCQQLLANPVIEDYIITVEETSTPAASGNAVPTAVVAETAAVSPLAVAAESPTTTSAASSQGAPAPAVAVTDVVPHPREMRSDASPTPDMQTAQVTAPHLSAPQSVSQSVTTPAATAAATPPTEVSHVTPAASPPVAVTPEGAALPNPFAVEYRVYDAMTTDEKLALQGKALQDHGAWIMEQINQHRAAWILCVGGQVVESGVTLESYPSDERLDSLGTANDLVPWVFTRPPTQ